MSEKINGLIWTIQLPREERYALLALGDHADHQGNNVYPSLGLIAWKTDYTPRRVQQLMRKLEARGILVKVAPSLGRGRPAVYRIDIEAAKPKEPLRKGRNGFHPFEGEKGEIYDPEKVKSRAQKR